MYTIKMADTIVLGTQFDSTQIKYTAQTMPLTVKV